MLVSDLPSQRHSAKNYLASYMHITGDVLRAAGLATITIGVFVLVGIERIEWDAAIPVITLILGYLTGKRDNGEWHNAKNKGGT